MSGVIKYLQNTSWLLGEKIFRMIVGLFVGIWLTRYLGPDKFGVLSYSQSFVALFVAFSTLGLDGIIIRELVKDESKRDKLLGTGFILKIVASILVVIFIIIALYLNSRDYQTNLFIFVISLAMIFQSFNIIDFYFQSKVLNKYIAYSNIFSLLISSVIKITLILNNAPLIYFSYVILFDSLIVAIGLSYFFCKNNLSIYSWSFDKKLAKFLLKESWPLIFSGVLVSAYMKIDQIMIDEILGSIEVGQYAAAVRLSEVWYVIPVVICNSIFPALINAKKINGKIYNERVKKLYFVMIWGSLCFSFLIFYSSNFLIYNLYGVEYLPSIKVLQIHIWAYVFVSLSYSSGKWLLIEGLQKYTLYRAISGLFINVILNFYLIPIYGVVGAAVATLIAHVITSTVFFIVVPQLRKGLFLMLKGFVYPLDLLVYCIIKNKR
nr:flippase [Photobacterium phosphoreum]